MLTRVKGQAPLQQKYLCFKPFVINQQILTSSKAVRGSAHLRKCFVFAILLLASNPKHFSIVLETLQYTHTQHTYRHTKKKRCTNNVKCIWFICFFSVAINPRQNPEQCKHGFGNFRLYQSKEEINICTAAQVVQKPCLTVFIKALL